MKILITGTKGLGKNIEEYLTSFGYDVTIIGSIDSYVHHLPNIINDYDVFINNEYKDTMQTALFELVYNLWEYEKKTIVNILTSALVFNGPNKKYIDDKFDLEKRTFELRSLDKEVRIINVYPNTLENNKLAQNQRLKFSDVSNIIKFVIELPQDIEIFEIGISKTKLKIENHLI